MSVYIALPTPTEQEILAIEDGNIEFGFLNKQDIIFAFIQFKNSSIRHKTSLMEFIIHKLMQGLESSEELQDSINRLSAPEAAESGLGLHVCLIDSNTRILKAQRIVGLSNRFSLKLLAAILDAYNNNTYSSELEVFKNVLAVQHNYTTKQLLKLATNVTIHFKK